MTAERERAVYESPPHGLQVDSATYTAILDHLRACLPEEGCGLVATRFEPGEQFERAMQFYPGTNILRSPTAFEMDPREVIAALKEIEASGWRLGAIVHSHPVTVPVPSETDLAQAFYPGALMVIVSFTNPQPEIRAWRVGFDNGKGYIEGEADIAIEYARLP